MNQGIIRGFVPVFGVLSHSYQVNACDILPLGWIANSVHSRGTKERGYVLRWEKWEHQIQSGLNYSEYVRFIVQSNAVLRIVSRSNIEFLLPVITPMWHYNKGTTKSPLGWIIYYSLESHLFKANLGLYKSDSSTLCTWWICICMCTLQPKNWNNKKIAFV